MPVAKARTAGLLESRLAGFRSTIRPEVNKVNGRSLEKLRTFTHFGVIYPTVVVD
jgi:hypothetical protein